VLRHFGFAERVRGSHRIFRHTRVPGLVNLQPRGSQAKPYQVRQIRRILLEYPFLWRR
jgi:predicted RNA binding protein YcfA (HicA-like mRNA interferase family)